MTQAYLLMRWCERFGLCPYGEWNGIDGMSHGERAMSLAYEDVRSAIERRMAG